MSEPRSFPWVSLLLGTLLIAAVLAVRYLPWWGVALLIGIPILCWRYLATFVFAVVVRRVARGLARALLGAQVEVHSLRAMPPPEAAALEAMLKSDHEDEDEWADQESAEGHDEAPEERNWYELDATITPKLPQGEDEREDTDWQPGALLLVPPNMDWSTHDLTCLVARVEIERDGKFESAERHMAYGAARLRLFFGVNPGTHKLVLRYLTENFGPEIELPAPHGPEASTC